MLYYRLYFFGPDGRIMSFSELEAIDDEAAIAQVRALRGEQALELWCQTRKVVRLEPMVAQRLEVTE